VLTRAEIRYYQSLADADVPLGPFTVITGPTGAGKSAFIRAMRLLAFNARGTSYVSTGAKSCSVTAGDGRAIFRIIRSPGRGANEYQMARLVPTPVRDGQGWVGGRYSKLGGQVPPQVAEELGLTPLNFASQLDPPFLLTVPGTELARALGELTNVSLVLNAAASANRVRKSLDRDLATAETRLGELTAEAQQYAGLAGRRRAVRTAEEALGRHQAVSQRLDRLRALAGRLSAAEGAFQAAAGEAARQAPPSLDRLDEVAARLARLRQLSSAAAVADAGVISRARDAEQAAAASTLAEETLHAALREAGQCPVCGNEIS
jgi:exonuclease SbcC